MKEGGEPDAAAETPSIGVYRRFLLRSSAKFFLSTSYRFLLPYAPDLGREFSVETDTIVLVATVLMFLFTGFNLLAPPVEHHTGLHGLLVTTSMLGGVLMTAVGLTPSPV